MLHGVNDDLMDVLVAIYPVCDEPYEVCFLTERTSCVELMDKNVKQWIDDNLVDVQAWHRGRVVVQ